MMFNKENLYDYYDDEEVDTSFGEEAVQEEQTYYENDKDDYTEDEHTEEYDTYDEENDYYDEYEYKKEKRYNVIYIILFCFVMFFAIIGAITLILPHTRAALFG